MLTATGNINQSYEVLGVMTISVIKPEKTGCSGGGLPVDAAYQEAVAGLVAMANKRGANGVIHIGFEHRVSSTVGCGNSNSNFELYAWGTAVALQ